MKIKCGCGCGLKLESLDSRNRARKYIHGHNGKGCKFLIGKCEKCSHKYKKYGPSRGYKNLCHKCYQKFYHLSNKKKVSLRRKQHYRELKAKVLNKLNNKCDCCGITDVEFLAINHVKGNGKEERNVAFMMLNKILKMTDNEVSKEYNLLCHNCNMSMGIYGYCPHKKENNVKI